MPQISIIVPVYKAEKYLHRCLDSILAQTMTDFELLLIDDGSPDRSGEMCDEYSKKDSRIRVFHKENGGVASARQLGMDNAQGEYSIHVDPDDWIDPDMLEKMYLKAKNTGAEMVICDFMLEFGNRQVHQSQHPEGLRIDDALNDLLMFKFNSGPCNKLIHNSCYKSGSIKFKSGMVCNEDFYVLCQLFVNGLSKVEFIPEPLYHYDKSANPDSISKRVTISHLDAMVFCINYLEANIDVKKYQKGIENRKKSIKRWMWNSGNFTKRTTIDTFREVNNLFADEKGRFGQHSDIYYGLNGHYWLGRILQTIHKFRK